MSFLEIFGRSPDATAHAPGRVNLIGEHTDYNGGFVLPIAIPQTTRVAIAHRDDQKARIHSVAFGETIEFAVGDESRRGGWHDYAAGVTATLRAKGFAIRGFDAWVESDVPLGSGLSSSASFDVALLRALRSCFSLQIDDVDLAHLAQRVENDFVGAPVGMMDPMAVTLAGTRVALFLDARSGTFERVELPEQIDVVVIDSGLKHTNVGSGYRERRSECERAAALLGVKSLRDVDSTSLAALERLPDPLSRRARHVVTENARVLRAVKALTTGDLPAFGRLLDQSHESMRDDFEISLPSIDRLVDIARADPSVHGARLTGGGFGGSIVAVVDRGAGRHAGARIASAYRDETMNEGRLLVPGG